MRCIELSVNLFLEDSNENPPESVAPLNEHLLITKYLYPCKRCVRFVHYGISHGTKNIF